MKVLYRRLWCVAMAIMISIVGIKAHADVSYLVLNFVDDTSTTFPLADNPIIKNSSGELIVESVNMKITVAYKDLKNYILSEEAGVEECIIEKTHKILDGNIYFYGLKEGEHVTIYSIDGKIITDAVGSYDGTAVIDMSGLGRGIFIARCNNLSIKFINK